MMEKHTDSMENPAKQAAKQAALLSPCYRLAIALLSPCYRLAIVLAILWVGLARQLGQVIAGNR